MIQFTCELSSHLITRKKQKWRIKTLNMIVRRSAFSLSGLAHFIRNIVTIKQWLLLLCLAEHLRWQWLATSFAGCNHAFTFLVGTKNFQSPRNRRIFADVIVFPLAYELTHKKCCCMHKKYIFRSWKSWFIWEICAMLCKQ